MDSCHIAFDMRKLNENINLPWPVPGMPGWRLGFCFFEEELFVKKRIYSLLCILTLTLCPCLATEKAAAENDGRLETLYNEFLPAAEKGKPAKLTLTERLMLEAAMASLWHYPNVLDNGPVAVSALIDPDIPPNVFAIISVDSPEANENGEWSFEGLIRQMEPEEDGIEVIAKREQFFVTFSRHSNGECYIRKVEWENSH